MPKKIPTPPPGDDEPKYLAVYKPYPLNCHWELVGDCYAFARWFACCVGGEDVPKFLAFFHKPRARGIVLVEMDRSYKAFDRLLGQHEWSAFLRNPSDEEKGLKSQVFYSTYPSGREAQKDGWKRINVEDDFFKAWSPNNQFINFPYPPTTWCPVPPEDRTNKPMCRPLPQAVIPAPPKPAPPVVGSAGWVAAQSSSDANSAQALRGAWGRGKPRGAVAARGGSNANARTNRASPTVSIPRSEQPIITNANANAKAKSPSANAWGKPSPASATASNATSGSIPWGSPPSSATSTSASGSGSASTPPGLASPLTPSSASASAPPHILPRLPVVNNHLDQMQTNMEALALGGNGDRSESGGSGRGVVERSVDDVCEIAAEEGVDPAHMYMSSWELQHQHPQSSAAVPKANGRGGGGSSVYETAPSASSYAASASGAADATQESLWADDDNASANGNGNGNGEEVLVCPTHGVICKRGICSVYAKMLREQQRAKARGANANGGGGAGGRNGGGGGGGRGGRGGKRGMGRNNNGFANANANGNGKNDVNNNGATDDDGFSVVTRKNNGSRRHPGAAAPMGMQTRSSSSKSSATASSNDNDNDNDDRERGGNTNLWAADGPGSSKSGSAGGSGGGAATTVVVAGPNVVDYYGEEEEDGW